MAKTKKPKPEPVIITQMRLAKVATAHGDFFRFLWVQTTDGEITETQFLNNYFDDPQACQTVIQGMIEAMQLSVVCVDTISRRH